RGPRDGAALDADHRIRLPDQGCRAALVRSARPGPLHGLPRYALHDESLGPLYGDERRPGVRVMDRFVAIALVLTAAGGAAGCRNEPLLDQEIGALPADDGQPGPTHRPGQPCLLCHSNYEGASPKLALGGTVF